MSVMNDLVCNAFYQISEEAGKLVKLDNRDTLHARDVNASVRLILPGICPRIMRFPCPASSLPLRICTAS